MTKNPSIDDISTVLNLPKQIIEANHWAKGSKGNQIEFRSPLLDDGVVMQGVEFRISCSSNRPNERVSSLLTIETSIGPRCFARVDWNDRTHVNHGVICGDYQFQDIGPTHYHDPLLYDDHQVEPFEFIAAGIPIAREIEVLPDNFSGLMHICAKLYNITNLSKVTEPQWQIPTSFL
ncbi:hypothetical protein [Phaeobacter sp. Ax4a-4a]|uniref:hypothetical protein n=1 Tax=Phaeobacter sp. Ax4a-4a TaxID=3112437 RepID=UPI003A8B9CDE